MPGIEVVLRESEDRFEVFSVEGFALLPGGSSELLRDLEEAIEEDDDEDPNDEDIGNHHATILWVAYHLSKQYPNESWSIKVERYDGYHYWLRFDRPELAAEETSRPASPEPQRSSRYRREPVI